MDHATARCRAAVKLLSIFLLFLHYTYADQLRFAHAAERRLPQVRKLWLYEQLSATVTRGARQLLQQVNVGACEVSVSPLLTPLSEAGRIERSRGLIETDIQCEANAQGRDF